MTDKQLIEMINNIRKYCEYEDGCGKCKFYSKYSGMYICQITYLLGNMTRIPSAWDMNRIEKIIGEQK